MGRFDTRRRTPPVRIGLAQARVQARGLLLDSLHTARGAGDYGMREARFASVPIRLRIDKSAGANRRADLAGTIPIGHTRRKAGFPVLGEGTLFGTPST